MAEKKPGWEPGIVYMKSVEGKSVTLTRHRCWNTRVFMHARMADAALATKEKKLPCAVFFLTEEEYRREGGR